MHDKRKQNLPNILDPVIQASVSKHALIESEYGIIFLADFAGGFVLRTVGVNIPKVWGWHSKVNQPQGSTLKRPVLYWEVSLSICWMYIILCTLYPIFTNYTNFLSSTRVTGALRVSHVDGKTLSLPSSSSRSRRPSSVSLRNRSKLSSSSQRRLTGFVNQHRLVPVPNSQLWVMESGKY